MEERDLVWKIYAELGATERHFNGLQSHYRTLASTWLLAAFGGIGFVLTTELSFVAVPAELAVALIGVAAAAGLYLLWMLDLLVYHRLLDAAFIEALRLEERHAWLPQVRTGMMRLHGARGVLHRVRVFYLAGFGLMALVATAALAAWALSRAESAGLAGAAALAVAAALLGYRMLRGTRDTADLRRDVDSKGAP